MTETERKDDILGIGDPAVLWGALQTIYAHATILARTSTPSKAANAIFSVVSAASERMKEQDRRSRAAERERIRQAVATFLELALEGHMPFGDPYFEGAKDYCEMILADIDAGEPKADNPDVDAPKHAAPHCIVRKP